VRLVDYLREKLSLPIVVENDANLSALGEFMKMEKEVNNMFYIHMDEGLGGGLIIDRSIFRVDRGYAGEMARFCTIRKRFEPSEMFTHISSDRALIRRTRSSGCCPR